MTERSVVHSTYVIERCYPTSADRIFAAFATPESKRRWFAEGEGFALEQFKMDFRIGGTERTRFRVTTRGPMEGKIFTNETTYMDIVPERRIVFAYSMAVGDQRISASLVSIELAPGEKGCTLIFTEQGAFFEGADTPNMREAGWGQLLEALERELGLYAK